MRELYYALGLERRTVHRHIMALVTGGLVERRDRGLYQLTPHGHQYAATMPRPL